MSVPKLRFKEFEGNWQNSILSKLSIKITDGTHDTPLVQKEGVPFLTAVNIKDGFINYDDIGFVDEITHRKIYDRCNPEKDDLLIVNIGAGTATCARNIVDYQFSLKNVALIKPNKKLLNPIFLEQIQRYNSARLFTSLTSGGAQPFLSLKELGKLSISYPPLQEQTKIASFLSAVDEKISQLTQKHELLSQYKQGMMQKLFSQQIRFKAGDGSEFGEWEEVRLGDLVDLISGFAFKSDYFTEEGQKLITPKNFTTSGKASFTHINTKWTTEEADKKFLCSPNDLLVLLTDLTQSCELLGKPILLNESDGNVLLNQRIVKVISNAKIEKSFLLYLLLTDSYHELIVSTASGTTVKHSSNKVIQSFEFLLPCLDEQTKIANFLSAIDQKIEGLAQQIEQSKVWKKGLLQQMFV